MSGRVWANRQRPLTILPSVLRSCGMGRRASGFRAGTLDEFYRMVADGRAEAGYVTAVPDLFRRLPCDVLDGLFLERLYRMRFLPL